MAFDDKVVFAANAGALARILLDAGILQGAETGFLAAPGVVYSHIGDLAGGTYAFVGVDAAVASKAVEKFAVTEAIKDPSPTPKRIRAEVPK